MAKNGPNKVAQAPAPSVPSHAAQIGGAAAAAMRGAGVGPAGGQSRIAGGSFKLAPSTYDVMNFNNNPTAQQEDFTPRNYRSKSTKQG